jgi:hypothetical protein
VGNGADGRRPSGGTRSPRCSSQRGSVSFTCLKWEHVIHPADLEKAARRAGFPIGDGIESFPINRSKRRGFQP